MSDSGITDKTLDVPSSKNSDISNEDVQQCKHPVPSRSDSLIYNIATERNLPVVFVETLKSIFTRPPTLKSSSKIPSSKLSEAVNLNYIDSDKVAEQKIAESVQDNAEKTDHCKKKLEALVDEKERQQLITEKEFRAKLELLDKAYKEKLAENEDQFKKNLEEQVAEVKKFMDAEKERHELILEKEYQEKLKILNKAYNDKLVEIV